MLKDSVQVHVGGEEANMPVPRQHAELAPRNALSHDARLFHRGDQVVLRGRHEQGWRSHLAEAIPHVVLAPYGSGRDPPDSRERIDALF
ncbi:MAG TPA: hypothetical protein VM737_07900 [Gemmatimonadota bacterium]|nr:hypothetical protein [Gemmatimonadota bacterium]